MPLMDPTPHEHCRRLDPSLASRHGPHLTTASTAPDRRLEDATGASLRRERDTLARPNSDPTSCDERLCPLAPSLVALATSSRAMTVRDRFVQLQVRVDEKGNNSSWVSKGGTGDYERLHGSGNAIGLPPGPEDTFIVLDIYSGKAHSDG